jgi:uncharacterized membrane protein YedE/YeeE
MNALVSFAAGLIFGLGLIFSGMTDPGKVKGFLDVAGLWDPSLAFVMAGAVLVAAFAFRFAGRRGRTFLGHALELPSRRDLDARLVLGSVVFGVGWGLGGFCPGPAVVSFASGIGAAALFVGAMLAGMLIFALAERARLRGVL